jgi:hypothetical protein
MVGAGSPLSAKLQGVLDELALDLTGRVVLTEAATGPYVVTALLASLAGAEVYAFAKDTPYGTAEQAIHATATAGSGLPTLRPITYVQELTPDVIASADVITNSGQLRPLDEALLSHAKESLVIPLMYEAWEWREGDVDLTYARGRGMAVGATNERHPAVDVFGYLGDMALKQLFDAGITPYRNRFVLVANNDFGPYIARVLGGVCAGVAVVAPDAQRRNYDSIPGVDWVGGFPAVRLPVGYRGAEAVVFTAYPFEQTWIGEHAPIDVVALARALDHPLVLRYAGDVDVHALEAHGIGYFPAEVPSGHMGVLPSAVGFDPVIRLQAGGLKAAEAMLTGMHTHGGVPVVELL